MRGGEACRVRNLQLGGEREVTPHELTFNSSLMREVRAIAFVTRLIDERVVKRRRLKRILIHDIDAEPYMVRLA